VSYSPDGRYLASGGGDTTVRFWDTLTSLPRHTCLGHRNHVLCTAWAPNGKRFASADKNGEIRLWGPRHGEARRGGPQVWALFTFCCVSSWLEGART
jgi:ribosome assembly protein 4